MDYKADHITHGCDYNPDQWIETKQVWDEDMRMMKLAHINSASLGIFSWSMLETEENVYDFSWLDEIMDKLWDNGVFVILATPSGARPAWLAKKYPEVLRVRDDGIRNEFGFRHNHCLTSPVYREKVSNINRKLAERYKNHPALKMWHISNEYGGECHCDLCQDAFRNWLKNYYNNDLDLLNHEWWGGFWSHRITDWDQINSPKPLGESGVSAQVLCWRRFVSDSHISFFENEIRPIREITPDIPVTTNLMKFYDGIDYQKLAKHLDVVSWDSYPDWGIRDASAVAAETAFVHDSFRSMKDGRPFFMMESTPSNVNWFDINKLPDSAIQELGAVLAIAHGADSVQYFQWRKGRGGSEKYHGAVVDHCGHENTRVFRQISKTGQMLEKLSAVAGTEQKSRVAIVCDWENKWATDLYQGFNNIRRDYFEECVKWYRPFVDRGISADVIPMDADFEKYDMVVAPYLYMLKDGTEERIEKYVRHGGIFVGTYLTGMADKNDLCYTGGFPAGKLKDVFGIWHEETDALCEDRPGKASFGKKEYSVDHVCDIIHADTARVLGTYKSDFYKGLPAVTENKYKKGKAYYAAFRNDGPLAGDLIGMILKKSGIKKDADIDADGIFVKRRQNFVFVMNFTGTKKTISIGDGYKNVLTGKKEKGKTDIKPYGYMILKESKTHSRKS